MRIGQRPFGLLRTIITSRSSSYTFKRPSKQKNSMGETVDGSETDVVVDTWLHAPGESNIETERGERLIGDLMGLAVGDADVQQDDEVSHGGERYAVEDVIHLPHENDKKITKFSLIKVTNP